MVEMQPCVVHITANIVIVLTKLQLGLYCTQDNLTKCLK